LLTPTIAAMFARGDKTIEHATKTSSMLFYLAIIIIHDAFKTAPRNPSKSGTSSYLDLAPLYGNSVGEQKIVRTGSDGKLRPDCFSEPRILGFPPGVSAFLICFNRFHNYVATMLAAINEKGRFTKPAPLPAGKEHTHEEETAYAAALSKYDEDLFQTARLVTCGLYVNIISTSPPSPPSKQALTRPQSTTTSRTSSTSTGPNCRGRWIR
jgi:hypothetical protein